MLAGWGAWCKADARDDLRVDLAINRTTTAPSIFASRGRLLDFATRCTNEQGELVLDGSARCLLPAAGEPG